MQAFTKNKLSGSINGKGILITATNTPGVAVHTGVAGTSSFDEVWLYATNSWTGTAPLHIEWGETDTNPSTNTIINIPGQIGRVAVEDGRLINNSLIVRAYSSGVSNAITIDGFVNQIV